MLKFDIQQLIEAANSELSQSRSRKRYLEIIRHCDDATKNGDNVDVAVLKSHALKELAIQSQSSPERHQFWSECVATLWQLVRGRIDPVLAENLAILTSELIQDNTPAIDFTEKRQHLPRATKYLDQCLNSATSAAMLSSLLVRKSSLLRCRALLTVSPNQKRTIVEESLRCARKAVDTHPHSGAQFEVALSNWAVARCARTDQEYVDRLNESENLLKSDAVKQIEVARLMLPRFYRLNYRPMEACEEFTKLESQVHHLRRFLGTVCVYAESVVQLWFQDYPAAYLGPHRSNALSLSERAIDAGFRDARNLLNIAYLRAIGGDLPGGEAALMTLSNREGSMFWDDVLALPVSEDSGDTATQSFVLGITDSHVLTRLGTFALRFLQDVGLAGRLYELAIQADERNPVALTNLARFKLRHVSDYPHHKIERLLQKADTYADRRFKWWRVVLGELRSLKSSPSSKAATIDELAELKQSPANATEIRKRFKRAQRLTSPQKRGYELERLVYYLARLSFGIAAPSYRFSRGQASESQVDCYFEHRGDRYRVECKWQEQPLKPPELVHFIDSLDVAGISGLIISMSGFKDSTIERAQEHSKHKPIILIDGGEMTMVFDSQMNFDELLTNKRLHFNQYSETYHRLTEPFISTL